MKFTLHPQLTQDSITLGYFSLCRLLLINDQHYPWTVLVPQVTNIREIYELSSEDQIQLIQESSHLGQNLNHLFQADKINIAAIGNLVPQLHIHHVVRYEHDPAWPAPIWGKLPAIAYSEEEQQAIVSKIQNHLLAYQTIKFIPEPFNGHGF